MRFKRFSASLLGSGLALLGTAAPALVLTGDSLDPATMQA